MRDFIICIQCGFYHESHQSPATDKLLKWNRYTAAELDSILGKGRWSSSVTRMVACPSGAGPAIVAKKGRRAA